MFLEKVTPYISFIAQQFDVIQVTHSNSVNITGLHFL